MLQYGRTLKILRRVKEVSYKISHTARFHLYEMSRLGKYMSRNYTNGCLGLGLVRKNAE